MIYVCKDKDFAEIRKMFNLILPKSVKCFGSNMPKSVKCLTILEEECHKSGGFYPPHSSSILIASESLSRCMPLCSMNSESEPRSASSCGVPVSKRPDCISQRRSES